MSDPYLDIHTLTAYLGTKIANLSPNEEFNYRRYLHRATIRNEHWMVHYASTFTTTDPNGQVYPGYWETIFVPSSQRNPPVQIAQNMLSPFIDPYDPPGSPEWAYANSTGTLNCLAEYFGSRPYAAITNSIPIPNFGFVANNQAVLVPYGEWWSPHKKCQVVGIPTNKTYYDSQGWLITCGLFDATYRQARQRTTGGTLPPILPPIFPPFGGGGEGEGEGTRPTMPPSDDGNPVIKLWEFLV